MPHPRWPDGDLGWRNPGVRGTCDDQGLPGLGPNVSLKGGYAANAVFLDGANLGLGHQVREGTLLEEEANGAHCVGLKQTILFPFVTLGSLINFCDCLMSGGTGRSDHSEVGSSYVHFNFTPRGDKQANGVSCSATWPPWSDAAGSRPIFLGGQGGAVGPVTVGYGSVVAGRLGLAQRRPRWPADDSRASGQQAGARQPRQPPRCRARRWPRTPCTSPTCEHFRSGTSGHAPRSSPRRSSASLSTRAPWRCWLRPCPNAARGSRRWWPRSARASAGHLRLREHIGDLCRILLADPLATVPPEEPRHRAGSPGRHRFALYHRCPAAIRRERGHRHGLA